MNSSRFVAISVAGILCFTSLTMADSFGSGDNQFEIDFVPILGGTNPVAGSGIVNDHYRIGVYEITNAQWDKFEASLGALVKGSPSGAYDAASQYGGANIPANNVSWYEAAQFVNYLNTSTGHHAAYNFTGTQGTPEYTFAAWSAAEADGGTNLYRHKDAAYFLPTEDEWVKAAYWNGSDIQTFATPGDATPVAGVDSHYGYTSTQPWQVGSGSQELNGTFDMMGNIYEWAESPHTDTSYGPGSNRDFRGGSFLPGDGIEAVKSTTAGTHSPTLEDHGVGFRVAAALPTPSTPEAIPVVRAPDVAQTTLATPSSAQLQVYDSASGQFANGQVDPNKPTVVLTHGWNSSPEQAFATMAQE
jgi:formylglycine-generating enzyme required for sulfatase activity